MNRKRPISTWIFTLLALAQPGPIAAAAAENLRILVSNDDGYKSSGLSTLVTELAKLGEVVVSAPDGNRSGSSHSIGMATPLGVEEVEIAGATRAVAVDGTPAAAVRFGLLSLGGERGFDLVVSGVNRGANVGDIAHYSGTVGAAMEGLFHGVPAIAVSQDFTRSDFTLAARFTAQLIEVLRRRGFPKGVVLSINVPGSATGEPGGAVAAPMGGSYIAHDGYRELSRGEGQKHRRWQPKLRQVADAPAGTDTAAYLKGHITVTPLRFDWTDTRVLEEIGGWLSELE